jgi:uncharacterized membrane protein
MKVLDIVQRVTLLFFLLPVIFIVVDGVLNFFDAREDNAVVSFFAERADASIWEPLETMFAEQGDLQTALLALAFWGIVVGAVALVFKGVRALLAPLLERSPSQGANA